MLGAPLRVLCTLPAMQRGGIQTWLMEVLRHLDRDRFHMDFVVYGSSDREYAEEIRALGSSLFTCSGSRRPWRLAEAFRRLLCELPAYQILHCHGYHYGSGLFLKLAREAGVPVRVAHSHSNTRATRAQLGPAMGRLRLAYDAVTTRWVVQHATAGLAVSGPAARSLFGPDWPADPRWQLFTCGLDFSAFRTPADRAALRASLGLPPGAVVAGHVGRFTWEKNHPLVIDIAREMARREPRLHLLLIGEGPSRRNIEALVARAGLTDRTTFAGLRRDVPRLMLGALDICLLPSLSEGLPLTGLEAQAAGLPLLFSDIVPQEMECVPGLLRRLPVSQPASVWADAAFDLLQARPTPEARAAALTAMEASPFSIQHSVRHLEELYRRWHASASTPLPAGAYL